MDIKLIEEFVVLSQLHSYAHAANELFTTQATLSRHIMSLEKELGQKLFYRTTRKVELTEFGEDFLPYATSIVQTFEECESYLLKGDRTPKYQLTVGVPGPVLVYDVIKETLMRFSLEHTQYSVELEQEEDEELLTSKLRNREYDIVILREPTGEHNDHFQRLCIVAEEPMCVVLPKNHPYAGRKQVTLPQLREEDFLLPPEHSYTYKLFVERCRLIGFEPKLRASPRGREIAASLARNGIGVPVLSRTPAMDAADETVSVVEITPSINQEINILYPKIARSSEIVDKVLECFENASRCRWTS